LGFEENGVFLDEPTDVTEVRSYKDAVDAESSKRRQIHALLD
jgi:hypothetical protein